MPNMDWDKLSRLQIGRYAEYYAKMEFASYGFEVYTSEVDDHGVDFVSKSTSGIFYEIQVKSLRVSKAGYVFILKSKMDINSKNRIVCLVCFINSKYPTIYLIPATAWKEPNELLRDRNYDGQNQKSKPE